MGKTGTHTYASKGKFKKEITYKSPTYVHCTLPKATTSCDNPVANPVASLNYNIFPTTQINYITNYTVFCCSSTDKPSNKQQLL